MNYSLVQPRGGGGSGGSCKPDSWFELPVLAGDAAKTIGTWMGSGSKTVPHIEAHTFTHACLSSGQSELASEAPDSAIVVADAQVTAAADAPAR